MNVDGWRCRRCGSLGWVAASLTGPIDHGGRAIKQCIPCGHYSGDPVEARPPHRKDSSMNELETWLRARLDEDEAQALEVPEGERSWSLSASATVQAGSDDFYAGDQRWARHIVSWDPVRVLAEVDAKRRLIDWVHEAWDRATNCDYFGLDEDDVLRIVALPYADRPGYREEWRP